MLEVIDLDEKRKKEQEPQRSKDEKIENMYNTIDHLIDILHDLRGELTEVLNE